MTIFANPLVADTGDRFQGRMKPWAAVVPSHGGSACVTRQLVGIAQADREDPAP